MNIFVTCSRQPWNKGKLFGQKAPLRLRDIWAIRVRLQLAERTRDLALFDLAIDSKLRACDLTKLRVRDANTVCYRGLDTPGPTPERGLPFSEPAAYLRPSINTSIRTYRQGLGESSWP